MTFAVSLLAAGALALLGHMAGWLTRSGAVAATVVGGTILTFSGIPGVALLALFFLSGSMLTYARCCGRPSLARTDGRPPDPSNDRGRTWRQVVANGGWATVGAVLLPLWPGPGWALMAGSLAAAQADTWGTEIGARSRRAPRLLTTGEPVPAGTSGGVTPLGTMAGIAGAGLMGTLAWALGAAPAIAAGAAVGGILGTLADSLLGATVQGSYHCDTCRTVTEHPLHRCGRPARLVRGYRRIDNDVVNLAASGLGGAAAIGAAAGIAALL